MTEQEKTLEAIAELQRQLALKEAADNASIDGSDPVEVAPTMDFVTRARLLAQGATLGFADELIARARSLSPNVTYDEAVSDERSALEKSREQFPVQSIAYEIGGALVPGLLAAPFTGGTSLAPAAARATALGAARVAPRVVRAAGVGAAVPPTRAEARRCDPARARHLRRRGVPVGDERRAAARRRLQPGVTVPLTPVGPGPD